MHETCPPAPPAATPGTLGQLGGTGSARQNRTQTEAGDEGSEMGFGGQQAVVWVPCPCNLQEEPTAEHTANSVSGFDFLFTFFIIIFKKPRGTPAILCVSRVPDQGLLPLLTQTPNRDHPQPGAAEKYWAEPLGSRHSWIVQADTLYPEPSCGTGAAAK